MHSRIHHNKITPLISGTLILTGTGFLSRIIGFFYRIFLSRNFGEEGMGIYQLISPVLALSFSFCVAGIQTSISKYVAQETSTHHHQDSFQTLLGGTGLSLLLSFFYSSIIYRYSEYLAREVLLEVRCALCFALLPYPSPLPPFTLASMDTFMA